MKHALFRLLILIGIAASSPALACQGRPFGQPAATVGIPSLTLAYSGTLAIGYIPVTVTLPPVMNGNCHLSLMIEAGFPMQLSLQHTQSPQHGLTYTIGSPFEFNGSGFHNYMYASQGQIYEYQIPVRIPADQTGKPAGSYHRYLSIRLINAINGSPFSDILVLVAAQVATSCTLPPPSLASLDFSSAIINGNIPTPFQRTFSFFNAGCNGPARLSLSGQPLRATSNAEIHFTASAILGGTGVTLNTREGAQSFSNAISAPVSGAIPISVTVLPTSSPLPAGDYSSVLTVSLEPVQ